MKKVAVLTEDGVFALFFCPHPRAFDSSRVPTPGNLPSKAKKMLMPGGQPRGGLGGGSCWAQLELTDALSISSIGYPGISSVHALQKTREKVFCKAWTLQIYHCNVTDTHWST